MGGAMKDAVEVVVVTFRAPLELVVAADKAAAREGISRSDITRRALRDPDIRRATEGSMRIPRPATAS
jgi:Ribbon-helix-helix protein, copG family